MKNINELKKVVDLDFDSIFESKREEICQQLKLEEGTLASELYKRIEAKDSGDEFDQLFEVYNYYLYNLDKLLAFDFASCGRSYKYQEGSIEEQAIDEEADIEDQLETIKNNSDLHLTN